MGQQVVGKICPLCEQYLPIDAFYYSPAGGYYGTYCKECDKDKKRAWYIANKKKIDEKRKQWQKENYEKHLEHQRKYSRSQKGLSTRRRYTLRKKAALKSAQQ